MKERDAIRDALRRSPKGAQKLREMLESGKLKAGLPDPEEEVQVLCMRWPGLVDDSAMRQCTYCNADVAVAPSTQEMIAGHRGPVTFMCMECAAATMTTH